MVASLETYFVPSEDYLVAEQDSLIKHEYRQGYAYAMAGASNTHVLVAGNFFALLRSHVRGGGGSCRTYISDTKVHIQSSMSYYYPDIVVSCDERDRSFSNFLRYPSLIIEVLSDTTEAFDRGNKFADYRKLESLQEYVLVSQMLIRVEVFRRNADGQWVLYTFEAHDLLHLASLDFSCSVVDLYEDVDFIVGAENSGS
jgi:Uma2 family endonuclease